MPGQSSSDHGQHQFSRRRVGIDVFLVADQSDIFSLQGLHQFEQVGSAASKAAEIMNVNGVALSGKFEHRLKLGAVGILARHLFFEPFVNLVDAQGFLLSGLVLFYG